MMKIIIDVHDAKTPQEAADWLGEATENFDIEYDVVGELAAHEYLDDGRWSFTVDPLGS